VTIPDPDVDPDPDLGPGANAGAAAGLATTASPPTTALPASPHADRLPTFAAAPTPPARKVALAPGPAVHLSRIATADPVAFITIDDGYVRHPDALALIRDSEVPVSLFLISSVAAQDPKYFSDIREQTGAVIQAHSVSHARLRGLSYEAQRREICGSADQLQQLFGTRPTLFRAPGGLEDDTTLRVAAECGMQAVMFWKEAVNDGRVQFQEGSRIQPGDVILMHFRSTFVDDYVAALQAIKDAGLTPARLEDYI
jgi:peptidoglycan/xylan/chitin deacetylase (PgdA/CDA1 family)